MSGQKILRDEDWVRFQPGEEGGFRRDVLYHNCFGFSGTRRGLEIAARDVGGEFLDSHIDRYTFDVIGIPLPPGRQRVEISRPLGIRLRYFDSHADRLADMQRRIDLARERAARRRSP